ncbi:putative quinol monooxygenase [Halalkalibacter alkaliphilus]|uniref:Antibiotic biosynthesis monooxygenase n=1 Tax=Halalkalibacter alkaliphilus TaxID=2917993 RepID=A0A9X2CWD4_9BACI|nr:putative quinol monooxygenase [Halalkalibacter alkaliphilus]MCL7749509.1 antibiotic biosynthesis monooxygenase [Halalkalibacter alkaliphilus]
MVIIHAYLHVLSDKRIQFLNMTNEIVKYSREEEGNISYELLESAKDPNLFVLVEKWKDEGSLTVHEGFEYFKKYVSKITDVLAEPTKVEAFYAEQVR